MSRYLIYAAFGWLTLSGAMHFSVDVVSHAIQGRHPPSRETTLYYGLHSAFALGQIVSGVLALYIIARAPHIVGTTFLLIATGAAAAWFAISWFFIEYRQPTIAAVIFILLVFVNLVMRLR